MKEDAFADIARYFQAVVEQLHSEARQARILENSSVVGGDREETYRRFLARHLPIGSDVFRGGYVFNLDGVSSRQMDLILTSGVTPRFNMSSGSQAIAPIEGVIGVAEIKSRLDRQELEKTLSSFADLPLVSEGSRLPNPLLKLPDHWKWDWPYKVLFAYDGIEKDRLYRYVVDYYRNYPCIPQERRPSLIHVLGKYAVFRFVPGMKVLEADGSSAPGQPSAGDYWLSSRQSDILAMMFMLTALQRNSFYGYQTITRFDGYVSEIAGAILRGGL